MKSFSVVLTYLHDSGNKYSSHDVYRCDVMAVDNKDARRKALFLAHAEGCKGCRVTQIKQRVRF